MTLLFRTDADSNIGYGHFMRSLALAQAAVEVGKPVSFIVSRATNDMKDLLKASGIQFDSLEKEKGMEDVEFLISKAIELDAGWIVVDGYQFDSRYQKKIKDAGLKLLYLDDHGHCTHYFADTILNQNISASADLYRNKENYTELLLGTMYTLLRKEFLKWTDWTRRQTNEVRKILITLGGGDQLEFVKRILEALDLFKDRELEVAVVAKSTNKTIDQLEKTVSEMDIKIRVEKDVTDLSELMIWADAAITAAGSTCWEMAFMELPILTVVLADNQRDIANGLERAGYSFDLGYVDKLSRDDLVFGIRRLMGFSVEERQNISNKGRQLVDGLGAKRVLEKLLENKHLKSVKVN